jgi:hypothetical protein
MRDVAKQDVVKQDAVKQDAEVRDAGAAGSLRKNSGAGAKSS